MQLITITTDLGYRDPYLAMVKGLLYNKQPECTIVDLACNVNRHAHTEGAFALKSALPYFANETIHLFAVKNVSSMSTRADIGLDNKRYLITKYNYQYIISPDNGLFTLMDKNFDEPVYQIYFENEQQHAFYLRDVFVEVALKILADKPLEEFSLLTNDYCRSINFESYTTPSNLQGKVIYEDDFGNLITSITQQEFDNKVGNKRFTIDLPSGTIDKISNTYDDVNHGNVICFFNSMGLLEIALNGLSATKIVLSKSLFEKYHIDKIIIEVYD
jgi:S-adenosylmethionine hydrolase